eukprot:2462544-Pyramimonas_sp.AAC.1
MPDSPPPRGQLQAADRRVGCETRQKMQQQRRCRTPPKGPQGHCASIVAKRSAPMALQNY